jgi:hypothetical protein
MELSTFKEIIEKDIHQRTEEDINIILNMIQHFNFMKENVNIDELDKLNNEYQKISKLDKRLICQNVKLQKFQEEERIFDNEKDNKSIRESAIIIISGSLNLYKCEQGNENQLVKFKLFF